jgi:predicted RNA-binding protein YlxR (DUF448 family)
VSQPVRTCLGCRDRAPQAELLRVVADAGSVRVDVRRTLPGRGGYLHPDADCLSRAVRRRAFGRALRVEVDTAAAGRVLSEHLAAGPNGPIPLA